MNPGLQIVGDFMLYDLVLYGNLNPLAGNALPKLPRFPNTGLEFSQFIEPTSVKTTHNLQRKNLGI